MIQEEKLERLAKSLNSCNPQFSNYQEIPDFVYNVLPRDALRGKYNKQQVNLDSSRYDFLKTVFNCAGLSVVEVGSNLGFFCLSLTHDFDSRTRGYDPLLDYVTAATVMAECCNMADYCTFKNESVLLNNIKTLPEADLIIELNVMHHAGVVFDKERVGKIGGWRAYAVKRLIEYRKKTDHLLFQTGNVANGETLFPTEDAVLFVYDMLTEAGWNVSHLGTISDLKSLRYNIMHPSERHKATTYHCQRNTETNLVDFSIGNQLVDSLVTGLANRPMWFCE